MKNLAAALVKAQSELPAVHKNATAKVKTKTGADYSYSYVTLDALLDVVLPALNSNGIALIQAPTFLSETGGMVLKTVLAHGESGETFEAQAPLKTAGTPQEIGSEISYARRYAIMSLLGIAADEDDDGKSASAAKVSRKKELPVVKTDDGEELAGLLADIDTVIDALAVAKGNDKTDWVAKLDEQNGTDWRTDVTSAQMVLAKVRRWASMSGAKVAA